MDNNSFFGNRYVRLVLITLLIALLFYMLFWIIAKLIGLEGNRFPGLLVGFVSLIASGWLVQRYFAPNLG